MNSRFLALFIILFILSSLALVRYKLVCDTQLAFMLEQSELYFESQDSIRSLNRELSNMQRYKAWHDTTRKKIAEIRQEGYKPDELLIAIIYDRATIYRSVNVDTLFQICKRETSYGSNNVKGVLGEEGWAQFTEETLRFQILFFEGDTSGFKMSDYSDNVTVTDWVFTTYIYAKMHKPKGVNPNWVDDWNAGRYKNTELGLISSGGGN